LPVSETDDVESPFFFQNEKNVRVTNLATATAPEAIGLIAATTATAALIVSGGAPLALAIGSFSGGLAVGVALVAVLDPEIQIISIQPIAPLLDPTIGSFSTSFSSGEVHSVVPGNITYVPIGTLTFEDSYLNSLEPLRGNLSEEVRFFLEVTIANANNLSEELTFPVQVTTTLSSTPANIPTFSNLGLLVIMLLMLAAGTIMIVRIYHGVVFNTLV